MKTLMQWTVADYHQLTELGMFRDRHPYPEDIFGIIEIAKSTLDYDLNDKKNAYIEAEIEEYWVLEINLQQVHQVYQFLNPVRGIYDMSQKKFIDKEKSSLVPFLKLQ